MDRNHKTMMVEDFVAAFAKAARVSDVPEEAITSDTHAPSYMFLAAEWNRSTVSERAYLLFGREITIAARAVYRRWTDRQLVRAVSQPNCFWGDQALRSG